MAAATASSSVTAASSASHTPSPDPSSSSAATCSPSRVLPAPAGPGQGDQASRTPPAPGPRQTSRSRPMNADSWAGRLFGSAGLPSDRSGGNSACRPAALQLEDPFRAAQVLQPVAAQIGQRRARRQPVPHQHRRRLRHQHLAPVGRPRPPGRPGAPPGPPGRWPSSPPPRNGCPSAPAPAPRPATHGACKGLLHLQHRRHARPRRGEHREERIPLRIHLPALMRGQRRPDQRVMTGQHLRVNVVSQPPEQRRRALNVGEQEREGLHPHSVEGRQARRRQLPAGTPSRQTRPPGWPRPLTGSLLPARAGPDR